MRSHTIQVGGHRFQIRSDAEPDYLDELAREVTERMSATGRRGPRGEQEFRAMAMVAIGLLDELKGVHRQSEKVTARARRFAEEMIRRIDLLLGRDEP